MTTLLRRKGRVLDAAATSARRVARTAVRRRQEAARRARRRARKAREGRRARRAAEPRLREGSRRAQRSDPAARGRARHARTRELGIALETVELADVQKKLPKGARLVEMVNYQPGDSDRRILGHAEARAASLRRVRARRARRPDARRSRRGQADRRCDRASCAPRSPIPTTTASPSLAKALHDLTFAKLDARTRHSEARADRPRRRAQRGPVRGAPRRQAVPRREVHVHVPDLGARPAALRRAHEARRARRRSSSPTPTSTAPRPAAPAPTRRSRAMQGLTWTRLPGTAQEADALEKSLTGATVYRDKHATEATLKGLHAPSILHLATHGFFLADADADASRIRCCAPGSCSRARTRSAPGPTTASSPRSRHRASICAARGSS